MLMKEKFETEKATTVPFSCLNCCTIRGVFEFSNSTTARFSLESQLLNGFLFRDQQLDTELVKEFVS